MRDGVKVIDVEFGSQQHGSIQTVSGSETQIYLSGRLFRKLTEVPVRYVLQIDRGASTASAFNTLVHELAHLYCGHLGTPNTLFWPDRRGRSHEVVECEAESIAYLVCKQFGLESSADAYLAGYLSGPGQMPEGFDLNLVMKMTTLIREMCQSVLPPRRVPSP